MQIKANTTYSVNGGAEQTTSIELTMPADFVNDDMGRLDAMSKAADTLVGNGQIMISEIEIEILEDIPA